MQVRYNRTGAGYLEVYFSVVVLHYVDPYGKHLHMPPRPRRKTSGWLQGLNPVKRRSGHPTRSRVPTREACDLQNITKNIIKATDICSCCAVGCERIFHKCRRIRPLLPQSTALRSYAVPRFCNHFTIRNNNWYRVHRLVLDCIRTECTQQMTSQ